MKKTLVFLCIILLTRFLQAQEFRIAIAPTSNVFHSKYVNANPWDSEKLGFSINLDYLFNTNSRFQFGAGVGYQSSTVLKLMPIGLVDYYAASEKIKLISFNLISICNLSKGFYISLDPLIDIQTNHDPIETNENQSGVGMSLALGGCFRLNNYLLFNLEPRLWMHNLISFHPQDSPFRLAMVGINLGLIFAHQIE